jgi:hypothetical protein
MEPKESGVLREMTQVVAAMRVGVGVILAAFLAAKFTPWIDVAEARTLALIMSATTLGFSFQPYLRQHPREAQRAAAILVVVTTFGLLFFFTQAR